ncbi:MAG: hemerythrin domain-containing protein [Rubrivivax sp.]|nr:hemerythrin domain-containing protein [Rubrivivax sp.]
MTSTIEFHRSPSAGFDEPFEMLAACHERVERMLALLEKLEAHVAQHGSDAAAAQAARDVMRYFDQAGPAHHEDEERHVFPPLLQDPAVADAVRRLQAEHGQMEAQWPGVRADLVALEGGSGALPPGAAARWSTYAALYRRHILLEDGVVYPAARQRLDDATQAAMGEEMARRRGVR